MNDTNNDNTGLIALVFVLVLAFIIWLFSACTSNHYFSINAEEMTNPSITYQDSTSLQNPF